MKRVLILIAFVCNCAVLFAQQKSKKQIEAAVEKLTQAMINADSVALSKLCSSSLSYGHSGGAVEDKAAFIKKITSGKSDFVTINLTDQQITISKKIALVRHKLDATTNDNGKPAEVHLKVLLVWQKIGSEWKLLARQAVKTI